MKRGHFRKSILGLLIVGVLFQAVGYVYIYREAFYYSIVDNYSSYEPDNMDDVDTSQYDNKKARRNSFQHIRDRSSSESDFWWKDVVDEVSITFTPSNSTDWCQGSAASSYANQQEKLKQSSSSTSTATTATEPINNVKRHDYIEMASPKTGIYLVKTIKAGSSTAAAVSLQIAEAVARQKGRTESCPHHTHHGRAYLRRQDPNFLWTIVREPAKRSISSYFFFVISRNQKEYKSHLLMNHMKHQDQNFQLKYIGLQSDTNTTMYEPRRSGKRKITEMVVDIMKNYHFIALSERMDESLVVMKLLFNFPDEAMVVLSSKRAGGFDDGNGDTQTCTKIQMAYTTPDVDEYIEESFQRRNYDYFLYAVVNRSLDRTIDMLGRDRVEREVQRHRGFKKLAQEKCADTTIFPCTEEGVPPDKRAEESCYFGDVGCGHECVQRVIREQISSSSSNNNRRATP